MTFDFMSFSTAVQSYQAYERMIKNFKAVCSETHFTVEKISLRAGLEPGTAR